MDNIEVEWQENKKRFITKNLGFEFKDNKAYLIYSAGEVIGRIELTRVGTWEQWCIFLDQDCYLSPGCVDECRMIQRILGGRRNKAKGEENE